jgi:hypothetical protein
MFLKGKIKEVGSSKTLPDEEHYVLNRPSFYGHVSIAKFSRSIIP